VTLSRVAIAEGAAYGAVQMQAKGQRKKGLVEMLVIVSSGGFSLSAQVLREMWRVASIHKWLRGMVYGRECVPNRDALCSLMPKWEECKVVRLLALQDVL
jgi:hypothetical protein